MATYHVELKSYSRSQSDPMRHLAYVTGKVIYDERTGLTHASGNRDRVVYSQLLLPDNAPEWAVRLSQNTSDFWNYRNLSEDRLNTRFIHESSIYFEYVIALPNELTLEQNIELVQDLVKRTFHSYGLAVQVSLHNDSGNMHVHINIADRALEADGWSKQKHRAYNRREKLKHFRALVADAINTQYKRLGIDEQVTHLSHKARGLRLEATLHEGPKNDRTHTDIASDNVSICKRNKERVMDDLSLIITEVATLKNVFTERDLSKTLLKRLDGDQDLFESLYPQLLAHPELVPLTFVTSTGTTKAYTTHDHHRNETAFVATAQTLNASSHHALESTTVETVIVNGHAQSDRNRNPTQQPLTYSDEQAAAIRSLTQRRDLALLHGRAGTGKTTVLRAVAHSYQQAGYTVMGMALSGVASQNLASETGIESKTLHRWMLDWNLNATHRATLATSVPDDQTFHVMMHDLNRVAPYQLTDRHVIILDEASMVDSKQFQTIVEHAAAAQAKLICVGDTGQLGTVTYGAPFRALKEQVSKDGQATLSTVYRQKVPWMREASERLHQRMDEGLLAYHQKGHISAVATRDAAIEAVAAAYLQGLREHPDRSHFAFSATRAGVSALNHAIRRGLLSDARLGEYVSETIPAFGRDLRVKDRVVLTQNATRMWVAEGQRVANEREMGRIYNGDQGTIIAIHVFPDTRVVCEVKLDRGGVALIDSALYKDIEYGYAVTVHKSQGMTIDHAYIYLNKAFRKALAYVALTRHRFGMTAVYAADEFKDYGALERHLLKASYDRMIVDYSLDEGEQQIADRFYQYQELIRTMAQYRQRVMDEVGDHGVGKALSRDSDYQQLMRDRTTLATQLAEDWGDVHTRLSNLTGVGQLHVFKAAGLKTAYARDREQTVTRHIQRMRVLRVEADALRTQMGAMPYTWDEPIVQRLFEIRTEFDRMAERLLSYRELRTHIEREGFSWSQLERQAARGRYEVDRAHAYLELPESYRVKSREIKAFVQESKVLHWQYQAMVSTHSDITQHMAYERYAQRQQTLNATAQGFVNDVEKVEHLLIKEGVTLADLHTRASCHRIQNWTTSSESIHTVCLGIANEIELEPALRNRALHDQLGLTVRSGLLPKTVSERSATSSRSRSSSLEQNKNGSDPTQTKDIAFLCKQMRATWDHYEAIKMSSTLGSQAIIHPELLKEAQRKRDHAAANLTAVTANRSLTPYSKKQWAAIHAFATQHHKDQDKAKPSCRSMDDLTKTLKERMPQLCEALISERPTQQRSFEWRYGSKGSLKVTIAGSKAGSFVNFETGERGNVIQFIALHRQCNHASALEWARQFVGEMSLNSKSIQQTQTPTETMRTPQPEAIQVDHLASWISQPPPRENAVPDRTSPSLKKIYLKNRETARYTYTDASGNPLFYVVRFEPLSPRKKGVTKMTLPLSYGSAIGSSDPAEWRFKKYITANGSKTPLYNLNAINDRPHVPILVVEGEKAAEAAQQMFPEMVVTTWQGGASAVHLSDWTSLRDREMIIWPDNDPAGQKAAKQIRSFCEYAGAKNTAIVSLAFDSDQPAVPPKWDLADALPQGITVEDIRQKVNVTLNSLRRSVTVAVTQTPRTSTKDWDFGLGD